MDRTQHTSMQADENTNPSTEQLEEQREGQRISRPCRIQSECNTLRNAGYDLIVREIQNGLETLYLFESSDEELDLDSLDLHSSEEETEPLSHAAEATSGKATTFDAACGEGGEAAAADAALEEATAADAARGEATAKGTARGETTAKGAARGEAAAEDAARGEAKAGDAAREVATAEDTARGNSWAGDAARGELTAGDAGSGESAAEGPARGDATAGDAANGEATAEDTAHGNSTAGNAAHGESTAGDAARGESTTGDAARGDTTAADNDNAWITPQYTFEPLGGRNIYSSIRSHPVDSADHENTHNMLDIAEQQAATRYVELTSSFDDTPHSSRQNHNYIMGVYVKREGRFGRSAATASNQQVRDGAAVSASHPNVGGQTSPTGQKRAQSGDDGEDPPNVSWKRNRICGPRCFCCKPNT